MANYKLLFLNCKLLMINDKLIDNDKYMDAIMPIFLFFIFFDGGGLGGIFNCPVNELGKSTLLYLFYVRELFTQLLIFQKKQC